MVDCTGHNTDAILLYRKVDSDDPKTYFIGDIRRGAPDVSVDELVVMRDALWVDIVSK